MSDAAPPPWVKAAPGLSAAHKFMLGVLWGYGPYPSIDAKWVTIDGDRQPASPVRCWESCETLAKLTDQNPGTVRKQLRRLAADGWILRGSGSMRTLAWRAPGVFAYGAGGKGSPQVTTEGRGPTFPPPGNTVPPTGPQVPPRVTTEGPQTLQEHSKEHSSNAGEARTPEAPTREEIRAPLADAPAPTPAQLTPNVTGKPRHDYLAKASSGSSKGARSPRLQAREQARVLDPWVERVRAVSTSAHYYLDQTADSTHSGSYSQLMRKARADYGDDGVIEALRRWEELGFVKGRPPAGKLWNSPWRAWVEGVLGIKAPKAGQHTMCGSENGKLLVGNWTVHS